METSIFANDLMRNLKEENEKKRIKANLTFIKKLQKPKQELYDTCTPLSFFFQHLLANFSLSEDESKW